MRSAELHECAQHGEQVGERVVGGGHALDRIGETRDALLEQRVDQAVLVTEVVVDGGRRVAAALAEIADREVEATRLDQQILGRVEDRAARLLSLARAAVLDAERLAIGAEVDLHSHRMVFSDINSDQ